MSPTRYIYLNYYIIYISSHVPSKYIVSGRRPITEFTTIRLYMVRSTIIVRASDALPLAASVDDEQVLP